jgi:hypothetical protein
MITDNFPADSAVPNLNGMPRPAPAELLDLRPSENELIARETQEIRYALEAFKAAVEAGRNDWPQAHTCFI